MTVFETQIVIRNETVQTIFEVIAATLNDLYQEHEFTVEELLLAFNKIMMTQRDIKKYYCSMR